MDEKNEKYQQNSLIEFKKLFVLDRLLSSNSRNIKNCIQQSEMEKENEEYNVVCQENEEGPVVGEPVTMTANMTVIGLLNGMIGGTCLVLPYYGLDSGWLTIILVCIIMGWISYYTAYLIILHLGKGSQIKDCILSHFDNDYKYMRGYSFFIWFSFIPYYLIYFRIICLQIEGLLGYHSDYIAPLVVVGLITIILLIRIQQIGEEILAYGIIGIIAYIIFLIWANLTAPDGPKTLPVSGQPITLASTLIMAYSIHDFMVANIIKNPNRHEYHSTVRKTLSIGTFLYVFITISAFSILNRPPFKAKPQTINDFFKPGEWQNSLIEIIYMTHMITAYPNFLIVSKLRFFQMFKIDLKPKINWKEAIYIIASILLSYFVYLSGVDLKVMVTLNGAVVGFTYVIIIPIWIHFKCVFYDRSSGYIQNDPEWNSGIVANKCECDNVYKNKFMLYLQTVFLVLVCILGVVLIVFTISSIAEGKD